MPGEDQRRKIGRHSVETIHQPRFQRGHISPQLDRTAPVANSPAVPERTAASASAIASARLSSIQASLSRFA